jgi:hypothetical protein
MGGVELVAPPYADTTVRLLIERGFVMSGPVKRAPMLTSACHENVAHLWAVNARGIIGIGTGYALSADSLWRQHSWGIGREGLLETTVRYERYFGILLQGSEADCFADSNLRRD